MALVLQIIRPPIANEAPSASVMGLSTTKGSAAMKTYHKRDFPLDQIRRYLEPGPIVLVSSAWKGQSNIMTMGWHLMMGFSPALFGCYIWEGNKFEKFGLTATPGTEVDAPLIGECYANFECRLSDASQIRKHGLFIWEVVKAHVATSPKLPETLHYRGNGEFMVSGHSITRRSQFKLQNL